MSKAEEQTFCVHEGLEDGSLTYFAHTILLPCERATGWLNVLFSIWQKLCQRHGSGKEIKFWVKLEVVGDPSHPAAYCAKDGVCFDLAARNADLPVNEDIASRFIEELSHLHRWAVRGIEPQVQEDSGNFFWLSREELVANYALDHEYEALLDLVALTKIAHWRDLLVEVEALRKLRSQGSG